MNSCYFISVNEKKRKGCVLCVIYLSVCNVRARVRLYVCVCVYGGDGGDGVVVEVEMVEMVEMV